MRKTKEEKISILKGLSADDLIKTYRVFSKLFDPFDDDNCESFELVKLEIIERLHREEKK